MQLKGVIQVAASYPAWQAAIIQLMKAKYDASTAQPKALPEIRELGPEINALPDVAASKFGKQAMLVAAQVKADFEERGVDAFDLKMPFDEMKFLAEQLDVVTRALGLSSVTIAEYVEGSAVGAKNIPLPGRPVLLVTLDGAAAPAAAAGAGAGSGAGAGAAKADKKGDDKKKGGEKKDKPQGGDDKKKADKKEKPAADAKADGGKKKKGGDKKADA